MNAKHTPGPWKLVTNELDKEFQIVGCGKSVCTLTTVVSSKAAPWSNKKLSAKRIVSSVATPNEIADAQLIAAAPELLSALQALLDDQRDANLIVLSQARAAIEKATRSI